MDIIIIAALLGLLIVVGCTWGPVAGAMDAEWLRRS
jgi:hypothetical protein